MTICHTVTRYAFVLFGLFNLGRGGIHLFKADGGAASIAGFDLTGPQGKIILMLFAAAGAQQIVFGVVDLLISLKYRMLLFALLVYHSVLQLLVVWIIFFHRALPEESFPGRPGSAYILSILAVLLVWNLLVRRQERNRGDTLSA